MDSTTIPTAELRETRAATRLRPAPAPIGTDRDANGIPWALLASEPAGQLKFAALAILNPPRQNKGKWSDLMAALAIAKPPLRGLRQDSAQWLRPELRVRVRHLKTKGMLRHATLKQFIME